MNADVNKETVGGTIICRSIGKQRLYGEWNVSLYDGCKNGCKYCDTHKFPMDHAPGYEPVLKADIEKVITAFSGSDDLTEENIDFFFSTAVGCILQKDIKTIGIDELKAQGVTFLYDKRDPFADINRYDTFITWEILTRFYHIPVVISTRNIEWMDDVAWRMNTSLQSKAPSLSFLMYVFTPGDEHNPDVPSTNERIRAAQRFSCAYNAHSFLSINGISDLEDIIYICRAVEYDDTGIIINICDEDIECIADGIRLLCLGEYLTKNYRGPKEKIAVRYYSGSFTENQITNVAPKDFSLILKSKDYYDELLKVWEKEKPKISECI